MKNKNILYVSLVIICATLHFLGELYDVYLLWFIFKPLTVIALIFFYIQSVKKVKWNALLFFLLTLASEIFHDFVSDYTFMVGMILTTLSHIVLIYIVSKGLIKTKRLIKILAFIPFALITYFFVTMFLPELNIFLIPAIAFGIVITILGCLSGLNLITRKTTSSMYFLMGVLFFYIEAISAGINRFYLPYEYFPALTVFSFSMSIYLLSKYLVLESNMKTKHQ